MRTLVTLISLSLLAPSAFADDAPATPDQPAAQKPTDKPADKPVAHDPDALMPPAESTAPTGATTGSPSSDATADAPMPAEPAAPVIVSIANGPVIRETGLAAVKLTDVPPRCGALARNSNAIKLQPALSARISLASCVSDAKLNDLKLIDGQESVIELETAAAPSLLLLDEVIAAGEPATKVLGQYAKAQLYAGMATRMLNAVPPATDASPATTALRDSRRAIVESMLAPWREKTGAAYQAVVDIAKVNHAALAKNQVVQNAVRDSRARLTTIARAQPAAAKPAPSSAPAGAAANPNDTLK